ncbi:diacylglycerol kinase eta-like [Bolinopsis microptera]|uniref:diacylglycerol kinase eta-like n=1 Tax=Bolinopsis microptera TaxID=2820187 RepID=UPI00307A308C
MSDGAAREEVDTPEPASPPHTQNESTEKQHNVDSLSSDSDYEETTATEGEDGIHRKASWRKLSTNVCRKGIMKEGHLLKHASSFQRSKRYHFILKEGKLFYGKDTCSSLHVEVSLTGASVAECSKKNVNNSFTIISPLRSHMFSAENRRDMEEWIEAISRSIAASSSEKNYKLEFPVVAKHNWYTSSYSRGAFCNVCRELLSPLKRSVLACEVCQMMAHKKCAAKTAVSCKWTHKESMPANVASDHNAMIHQWMEGNLTSGSKCGYCDKLCGVSRTCPSWRCLWCHQTVHGGCRSVITGYCDMGPQGNSILSPQHVSMADTLTVTRVRNTLGCCPLLVFINSKSGDAQGVKFLRKFKELLNPIQVFDLMNGGPMPGLMLFQELEQFRVMVCGGDGSVGWVLSAIDQLELHQQCQFGILPLGTGNDLARVFGWGSGFDNEILLPQVLFDYNHAGVKMLDRWSILIRPRHVGDKRKGVVVPHEEIPLSRYQDSIAKNLLQLLGSDDFSSVLHLSRSLCRTIKDFVIKIASAMEDVEEGQQATVLQYKCSVLNEKLNRLLDIINRDIVNVESGNAQLIESCEVIGRANSLRRAVQRITDHIEQVVETQQNDGASLHIKDNLPLPMSIPGLILPTAPRVEERTERRTSSVGELDDLNREALLKSSLSRSLDEIIDDKLIKKQSGSKSADSEETTSKDQDDKGESSDSSVFSDGESIFRTSFVTISQYREVNVMNNYFGIGLDARISLEFHLKREEHPEKFHSRAKNIMRYGVISGRQFFMNKYKNLNQRVHMECDGIPVQLPTLQGIVVLNITSYMGGTNFWGTGKGDDGFNTPAIDDRMLEVVGVVGVPQLGISYMIGGLQHHRLAQCRSVRFTVLGDPVPVQVDGEAWMQEPGYIKIIHKNRAQMLFRDKNFKHTLSEWNSKMEAVRVERGLMSEVEVQVMPKVCEAVKNLITLFVSLYKEAEGDEDLLIRAGRTQSDIDILFSRPNPQKVDHAQCVDFLSNLKSMLQEISWYMKVKLPSILPVENSALRARVEGAIATTEEELRLLPDRVIRQASSQLHDSHTGYKVRRFLRSLSRLKITATAQSPFDFESSSPDTPPGDHTKDVSEWDLDHVIRWLNHLDLSQYCDVFKSHDIHGRELLELSHQDIKDLGLVKVGHIKRLLNAISELKQASQGGSGSTRRMSSHK